VQVGDCMAAFNLDAASMDCCHSMPCTPSNHSHGCCKQMMSAQTPNLLPGQNVSLQRPIVTVIEYPLLTYILGHSADQFSNVETKQHSPPDLYTLYASFLI